MTLSWTWDAATVDMEVARSHIKPLPLSGNQRARMIFTCWERWAGEKLLLLLFIVITY